MSLALDYTYLKDIKSYRLPPGSRQEVRQKSQLKGSIKIRITSSNPITVQLAGPHVEQVVLHGSREFSFDADADTEFYVGLHNKTGLFAKSADVAFEVQMNGSKKAYQVMEKVKNITSMLLDNPDFYELQKDTIQEVLREVTEVWSHYGNESKRLVNELISITKKLRSTASRV